MIQLSGIHRCLYTQQFERKQGDKVKLPSTSVLLSPVSPEALCYVLCLLASNTCWSLIASPRTTLPLGRILASLASPSALITGPPPPAMASLPCNGHYLHHSGVSQCCQPSANCIVSDTHVTHGPALQSNPINAALISGPCWLQLKPSPFLLALLTECMRAEC